MNSTFENQNESQGLQFHVARGETPIGRFTVTDILARVERRELDPFDHIYDENLQDWVAIATHPSFAKHSEFWEQLRLTLVQEAKGGTEDSPAVAEWFVLKGDHRFGPFEYLELVRLTQEKGLQDWDYVWNKKLAKWARLATLPEFQPEAIQKLRLTLSDKLGGTLNEVFFRRRYARATFEGSILVHNHQKLFKGKSHELGAGGMSLTLLEGELKVGDKVHVHIKPSKETPAFNTSCEVMSRRVLHAGDPKSPVVYGMKFSDLDKNVRSQIDTWATGKNDGSSGKAAA